jgi:hypothetical protein
MADPQDRPETGPDGAPTPPAKKQPAKKAAKAPAKKAPAKKVPAKKAPAAQKAPAKKAPAKKAPAKSPEPAPPKLAEQLADQPASLQQRAETNGQLAAGAKDAAAQAKSTVESANDPLPRVAPDESSSRFPVPLVVAATLSLLAMLLIRQLRRR